MESGFHASRGGGSTSSSSSLSASAPPFTVERPIAKPTATPLVDLAEPAFNSNSSLNNWLNPCSPDYFSESSKAYPYSSPNTFYSAQAPPLDPIATPTSDAFSYNTDFGYSRNDFVGAKPYCPSYVSPNNQLSTSHLSTFDRSSRDHGFSGSEHTAHWGDLWDVLQDLEQGETAQLNTSFCSEEMNQTVSSIYEDRMNLGTHAAKGFGPIEESSLSVHMLGREKQVRPVDTEKVDYLSLLVQNPSLVPVDYSRTSVLGSALAIQETNLQTTPINSVDAKNNQVPYRIPYERHANKDGATPSDTFLVMMTSSPLLAIDPKATSSSSSASNAVPFKNFNSDSFVNHTDSTSNNNPYSMKDSNPLLSCASNIFYDPSQLSLHLDKNHHIFELSSTKNEEFTNKRIVSKDVSGHLSRAVSGEYFSHSSSNGFNKAVEKKEPIISAENSIESLDHYSTTVDSPCWKGAPASHNTPFQSSEVLSTQFINNQEAYSDANSPAPWFTPVNTANVAKVSFEKPGETLTCDEDRCLQDGLMPCTGKFLVSGMPLRGGKSDDSRKIGSYNGKARCGCAIKFSNDTTQLIEANIITKKSIHEYDLKPSHTMQQSLKEGRMPSQRLDSPKSGVEDVGMKLNDVLEYGPSHMSLHAMANMSSSPYSAEDIPSKLANYFGQESIQTMDIHLIVNTVHNLSELLLYYSSNEACGLKEQDYVTLKSVINNLDRCLAKNMRQESLLVELDKSMSIGKPHVGACDSRARPDNGHLQDKSLHFGKKDEGVSDNFGVRNDAEIKWKDDKITQTIKKVLSENFQVEEIHPQTLLYKNLWLEAEAALCSMNYIARYNRMKLEMEQCKLDSAKVALEESTREENLSYSKFSNSTKTDNKSTPAFKDHVPTVDASIPHFPIMSSSSCADDVVARFNILKGRDDYSGSGDARDVENVPGFEMYSTLDKAMDSSNPDLFVLESPNLSTSSDTDAVEASVTARFHILKCCDDISVSEKLEEQVVRGDVLDLSFAGDREQCPETDERAENEILDVNVKGVEQLDVADHAEYELAVKNEPVIQSPRSYVLGNHFSVSCSESCSSDWEHVLKEDIPR